MKLNLLFFGLSLTFLSNVASWIVNLEEMKIFDSDKEEVLEEKNKKGLVNDELNNDKNSIDKSKYDKEYEYQGYDEKKVTNAIRSGSRYLEGLSKSLFEYRQMLESCGDNNVTASFNKTEQIPITDAKSNCSISTKNGKIVQRLSELALQTAQKLKEKTYNMDKDGESEENELVLQLAWYLDHLARFTGYVPDNDSNTTTTTTDSSQSKDDAAEVKESGNNSSFELLETVENGRSMPKLPPRMTADKIVIVKRSIEPLKDVVKYYTKYQLWNGSNLNISDSNFDIDNQLRIKSVTKRSILRKKFGYLRSKNITKMFDKIGHIDNLRKRVVKVTVIKKNKNKLGQ